jgi:nucleotide-binding universal stress UspA family protein
MLPSMAAQARKILIGFDGSEASRRALDVAARLTGYGSLLSVVTVTLDGNGGVRGLLDEAHTRLLGHQVTATYLERVGDPAQELVEAARELETDLVVVGRRGEAVEGEPVPGSVSAEVVRTAPCDVLVVR